MISYGVMFLQVLLSWFPVDSANILWNSRPARYVYSAKRIVLTLAKTV